MEAALRHHKVRRQDRVNASLLFIAFERNTKMRTTFSTLRCNLLAVLLFAATPLTAHAALTEWTLPPGSQPRQIDASSPSGLVYFVDQGTPGLVPATVNQLNQGVNQL